MDQRVDAVLGFEFLDRADHQRAPAMPFARRRREACGIDTERRDRNRVTQGSGPQQPFHLIRHRVTGRCDDVGRPQRRAYQLPV
jgi:hypothetical protein